MSKKPRTLERREKEQSQPKAKTQGTLASLRDRIVGLQEIDVHAIRGMAGNPKTPSDDDKSHLDDSLANHGYVMPMAVRRLGDGTYELIDGHTRLERILDKYPNTTRIKAILLDVASVVEGRRIVLALQHTTGFDDKKLNDFVRLAMSEGATAAQLMIDSGYTGKELDAFAKAGSDFLSSGSDEQTKENVSRAGLTTEHVQFAVALTRDQSATVHAALKMAKQLSSAKVNADALVAICENYLAEHRTH